LSFTSKFNFKSRLIKRWQLNCWSESRRRSLQYSMKEFFQYAVGF